MRPALAISAACALAAAPTAALAQTPSFTLVGSAPGTSDSFAYALSADGSVAAGTSFTSSTLNPGFTWTSAGGRYDFGLEPGMPPTTSAAAISGDGSTVVGRLGSQTIQSHAYRRVGSGPLQDLGLLSGYTRSYGTGTDSDGSTVVGRVETGSSGSLGQAFRWTAGSGMQGLGYSQTNGVYSEATGISRDGATIVGNSRDGGGSNQAFIWRQGSGFSVLPSLPGTIFSSYAYATNFDGGIVVGESGSPNRPTMWRDGQPIDLGATPLLPQGRALAVSDSGDTVVGFLYSPTTSNTAFVWTQIGGTQTLADYLTANGALMPPGWTLSSCYAVSSDGSVFVGDARSQSGQHLGFVAAIPEPATLVAFGLLAALRRRRRANS